MLRPTVFGTLEAPLSEQGLDQVKGKFNLIIIPQALQYMLDPLKGLRVVLELLKPGGYLLVSSPFTQIVSCRRQGTCLAWALNV